jgi:hypothetical protein
MARQQSAGELSRTIAGQWSKSEKRERATREIMEARRRTHAINKKFAQQQRMA